MLVQAYISSTWAADFRTARVALHHRWWARNYDGTVVARVRKQLYVSHRRTSVLSAPVTQSRRAEEVSSQLA